MLIIGIICLVVAAVSYFRYLSEKNATTTQKSKESRNEAKWQRTLAIIFLVLGVLLVIYGICLKRF